MGATFGKVVAAIGCVLAVAAGIALTVCTGGLGAAIIAGALIGFGMAGFMYTVTNWKNFNVQDFFTQAVVGGLVGAVGGGLFHGVAGVAAQFAGSLVKQTIVYTVGGAVTGFICNVVQNVATGQPVFKNWWQSLAIGAASGLLMGLATGLADKLTNVMVKSREALKAAEASIFKHVRTFKEFFHFAANLGSTVLADVVAQLILTGKVDASQIWVACGTAAFMGLAGAAGKRWQNKKDMKLVKHAEDTRQAYHSATGKRPEMTCVVKQRGSKSLYAGVNSKTNRRMHAHHGGEHPRQYRAFQKRAFGSKARFRGENQMPCAEGQAMTKMMRANKLHQGRPDTKALNQMLRKSKGIAMNAYGQVRPPCKEACRGQFGWRGYEPRRWFQGPKQNYTRVTMGQPPQQPEVPELPQTQSPPPIQPPQPPFEQDPGDDDISSDASETVHTEELDAESVSSFESSEVAEMEGSQQVHSAEADACDMPPDSQVEGDVSAQDVEATAACADVMTQADPEVDGTSLGSVQEPAGATTSGTQIDSSDIAMGQKLDMQDAVEQHGVSWQTVSVGKRFWPAATTRRSWLYPVHVL